VLDRSHAPTTRPLTTQAELRPCDQVRVRRGAREVNDPVAPSRGPRALGRIDVAEHGDARVFLNMVVVAVLYLALAYGAHLLGGWLSKRADT
jgi:hypothetical protein